MEHTIDNKMVLLIEAIIGRKNLDVSTKKI